MRVRVLLCALVSATILLASTGPVWAEPGRTPEIEIGSLEYSSDEELDAAEEAAIEAASFDPTIVSDFDLVGSRAAVVRNLALRQKAHGIAAEDLNQATADHLEAKRNRREAASNLEALQNDLREFAVDSYQNGAQLEIDRLSADTEINRRAYSIQSLGKEFMERVTNASNELLQLIEIEKSMETVRESNRAELVIRENDQARAIEILRDFEAAVVAREEAIRERIKVTLAAAEGDVELVAVNNIKVSPEIGEQLELMLEAALSDGIELGGGGYRSRASQIDLRRAHCGSSEYAIFDMASSQCSPPTAPPGRSQHELGLAIDFTEGGSILTWQSPGFFWLEANAEEFGFFNLPSEAWHWSTTGH